MSPFSWNPRICLAIFYHPNHPSRTLGKGILTLKLQHHWDELTNNFLKKLGDLWDAEQLEKSFHEAANLLVAKGGNIALEGLPFRQRHKLTFT